MFVKCEILLVIKVIMNELLILCLQCIYEFLTAKEFEVPESFAIDVTAASVELYDAISSYRYTTDDAQLTSYFYLKDI